MVSDASKASEFERVAMPHLDAAYNLARWLTRNNHDAQDIVQEAYLRAFRFFDGFRGDDARAWLMAIVRNTCYSWLQQRRASPLAYDAEDTAEAIDGSATMERTDDDPAALLAHRDERQALARALEAVPLEFREILILRELEELSYKQIAAIADIPIGTVMSRLARGRKMLAETIKRMTQGATK